MEWPLVGRAGELGRLAQLVIDAECRGAVIAAPAGAGKTRLALECLELARRARMATAQVMASQAVRAVPFGALTPLLPSAAGAGRSAEDRASVLRAAVNALAAIGEGERLMVMVDDAHLLDDASATVVYQLATTTSTFVLATVRSGELAPDPITALWKDGLAERLELPGLTADAIAELLARALGGPVDPGAASLLAERCRGNVLYLRELVVGATQDGTLHRDGWLWRLSGPLSPSDRLVELIESRLAGLFHDERRLMEVVSFGEPLGTAELEALSDVGVLERLEQKSLLTSSMDGRRLQIRLEHPLYGDVLRARTPATRGRRIARDLAEIVEATSARRRGDTLRVATWRLIGGGGSAALMLEAASLARWLYDWELAERLARAAQLAGAGFDADLLLAQLASLHGHGTEAEVLLEKLTCVAVDDRQRSRVAMSRLDNFLYAVRPADGLRVAAEAEAAIADDGFRDAITARRAWLLAGTEGPSAGIGPAEAVIARASGSALAWACLGAEYCLTRLGRLDEALSVCGRGFQAQLDLDTPLDWYPWWHDFVKVEALTFAGRLDEAESLASDQYERGIAERSLEAQAYFSCQLARVMRERGRVASSAGYARVAVALFRRLDRPMFIRDGLQELAMAEGLAGAAAGAASAIEELNAFDLSPYLHTAVEMIQARAWAAVAAGQLVRAREHFLDAGTLGEEIGDHVGAAEALHGLVRIGHARPAADRLVAVCAKIDGPLAVARSAHARAAGRPEALEQVSADFEALGAWLVAAEAAADAAVAWQRAGDRRRSTAARRRMTELGNRCEGASTPALHPVPTPTVLAPSEREAAILAADRLSNKEIAAHLGVSVRSVENRLQQAYEKLGIRRRAQLAEALGSESD